MKRFAAIAILGAFGGGLGLLGLAGWFFQNVYLTSVRPGLASMKPLTALAIILVSGALVLRAIVPRWSLLASILAGLAGIAGVLAMAEHWFGIDFVSNRILPGEGAVAISSARMAESTATSIIFLSFGFLVRALVPALARSLTVGAGVIPLLALFGYAYGFRALYDVTFFSSMALNTAVALFALSGAQYLSSPTAASFQSAEASSPLEFWREVVVLSVLVPFFLGWLVALGLRAKLYEPAFAVALLTLTTIIVLTAATARSLRRAAALEEKRREIASQSERLNMLEIAIAEDRYRSLVVNSLDLIITHDLQGRILSINPAVLGGLGLTDQEILGRHLTEFLTPRGRQGYDAYLAQLNADGHASGLMEVATKSGQTRLLEYRNTLEQTREGNPIVHGHSRDVTDRISAERRIQVSEERYRSLFERNLAGGFVTNAEGKMLEANEALAKMLGYDSRDEVLKLHPATLYADPDERAVLLSRLREEGGLTNFELKLRRKDGGSFWGLTSLMLTSADGGSRRIEGNVLDITARKDAEHQMWERAYHDSLTGLPNRLLFSDRLEKAIAHAERTGTKVAVCFLDLDFFKTINDQHGHAAGDYVLQEISRRIQHRIRVTDTVARMSGDEFAIFFSGIHDRDEAATLAAQVIEIIDQPFAWREHSLRAGGSLGISLFPTHGHDADLLLKNADQAMYQAKSSGRGRVVFFSA